jgi:transposase
MITFPPGVRVRLAMGHTDMRRGFPSLALIVQEQLKQDPYSGHLFIIRGRRGGLIKVIWHDGQGACLFSKKLERGRFIWPTPADGAVTISPAGEHRRRHGDLSSPAECGTHDSSSIYCLQR